MKHKLQWFSLYGMVFLLLWLIIFSLLRIFELPAEIDVKEASGGLRNMLQAVAVETKENGDDDGVLHIELVHIDRIDAFLKENSAFSFSIPDDYKSGVINDVNTSKIGPGNSGILNIVSDDGKTQTIQFICFCEGGKLTFNYQADEDGIKPLFFTFAHIGSFYAQLGGSAFWAIILVLLAKMILSRIFTGNTTKIHGDNLNE